eukprot:jgi/Ulvmu1/2868/UM146_0010.1
MGCITVGEVEGSAPNWRLANVGDHGVRRTFKPKEALSSNWTAWTAPLISSSSSAVRRPERRGKPMAEPCLMSAHTSYYDRRGLDLGGSAPETYRCHMQRIPQERRPERREGIKLVRPLERLVKTAPVQQRPKDNSLQGPEHRQPCTMKLGRDYAMPCTAQCDNEV